MTIEALNSLPALDMSLPRESAAVRGPVKACPELAAEANRLARTLRTAPRFTSALETYLGFALRREPRIPACTRVVSAHDALLLDVELDSTAVYREGWLVPCVDGPPLRAAAINALVLPNRWPGGTPGTPALSQQARFHRNTHYAFTVATRPVDDYPVVHVSATLLVGGRPVALVRETVYWHVITHHRRHQQVICPTCSTEARR